MPQKKPTAKKQTTTKKAVVSASKKTVARKKAKSLTLAQRLKGSISKKALIVGASVIVFIGLGAGAFALTQDNGASAAGSWTNLGKVGAVQRSGGKTISATAYACKTTVPKQGVKIKAYVKVASNATTNVSNFKASISFATVTGKEIVIANTKLKAGTTVSIPYTAINAKTYATTNVKVNFYPAETDKYNASPVYNVYTTLNKIKAC